MNICKNIWVSLVVTTGWAAFAAPELSEVAAEIVPRSGAVKITYALSEDAVVTLDDVLVDGVSIGASNVTKVVGACHRKIKAGTSREIYWLAKKEAAKLDVSGAITAKLTAYALSTPPDYMLFELLHYATARNWSYSTEFVCTNMAYATRFYSSEATLPDGGRANIKDYYNKYLVMRKIPAKDVTWRMGYRATTPYTELGGDSQKTNAAPHYVKLTADYYIGIYPVTHGQEKMMLGSSLTTNPRTDYTTISVQRTGQSWGDLKWGLPYGGQSTTDGNRSIANANLQNIRGMSYYWPENGHDIPADKSLGLMRSVVKEPVDLPTEAQWEFAARAGSDAPYGINGGIDNAWPISKVDGVWTTNVMIWCRHTTEMEWVSTWDNSYYFSMPCGLLVPNDFGLYDIYGNAWELCLDRWNRGWESETDNWYMDDSSPAARETYGGKTVIVDPIGPAEFAVDKYFCLRGGSSANGAENGTSNFRYFRHRDTAAAVRLVCPVPTL